VLAGWKFGIGLRISSLPPSMLTLLGSTTVASPQLDRRALIIFSRHGIRVPYAPEGGAQLYSKSPTAQWYTNSSAWGAQGEAYLTQHGEVVLGRMGEYYHERLVRSGFIAADGSDVTIYADHDKTGRDVRTATAFFGALLPGVRVPIHTNETWVPMLFNQGAHLGANNTACAGPTQQQVPHTPPPPVAILQSLDRGRRLRTSHVQPSHVYPSHVYSSHVYPQPCVPQPRVPQPHVSQPRVSQPRISQPRVSQPRISPATVGTLGHRCLASSAATRPSCPWPTPRRLHGCLTRLTAANQ
jgi:hypothetical protein